MNNNEFSKIKVDMASAFTAVCAYHPFRTSATRVMAGMPLTINFRQLYAGFIPSVIGSHQLFVISIVFHIASSQCNHVAAAVFAGIASAPTVTICDGLAVRKQIKGSFPESSMRVVFRGIAPTIIRQVGLAFGMFVFPSLIEEKISAISQEKSFSKASYSFFGGIAAAVLTHYPDTMRVVMQSHPEMDMRQAFRTSFSRTMSFSGAKSCLMRVGILSIAFTTMRWGKENFPKILNK